MKQSNLKQLRRNIEQELKQYVYDLSNPNTWAQIEENLVTLLGGIQWIDDYIVVCNYHNNLNHQIAQGILKVEVAVRLIGPSQFYLLPFTIKGLP